MDQGIKIRLYKKCHEIVADKIRDIELAISEAQDAANQETKSTAGDKHDTARAMMQLEVEQKSRQLAEAKKLKQALASFDPTSGQHKIEQGSLIITETANYYISIGLGKLEVDRELYFAISPLSPIAQAVMHKKNSTYFEWNGKKIEIKRFF
ncbi:MAG: 3-oxoacyl-ACP synthase [Crocinitomicaceae bacterium]